VSIDGGSTWTGTTRQSYNFFEYSSGFGTTTVDVKVTGVDGAVIIVNDVQVASGVSTTASSNFGSSGAAADISPAASSTAVAADINTTPSPAATSTQGSPPPSQTTDAAGMFEPALSSTDDALPSPTSTPTSLDVVMATMTTVYMPSTTTAEEAVSAVTSYVYETCAY
jgi:expansin